MSEREYRTNETDTNRQMKEREMAGAEEGYEMLGFSRSFQRENSTELFSRQQKLLEHNFNKESGELKGLKKVKVSSLSSDNESSRGSLRKSNDRKNKGKFDTSFELGEFQLNQLKQHKRNVQNINNITAKTYTQTPETPEIVRNPTFSPELRERRFQFSFISFLLETTIAYGVTIGLFYLIKITNFPFFLLLLIFGLMYSISPWSWTNTIMLVACAIVIGNFFLDVQILTYPSILICYMAVLLLNEKNKVKIVFIGVFVCVVIWGFIVIPALYYQFENDPDNLAFYYVFPIFVFMIRNFLYVCYRWIGFSEYIYLQLPLFLLGLEFGVMMTLSVSSVEFWYLMVFFTLQISNDRSELTLGLLVSIWRSLHHNRSKKRKNSEIHHPVNRNSSQSQLNPETPILKILQKNLSILPAHTSGYNCIHSLHIVCLVYVFTKLPLFSPPYSDSENAKLLNYIEKEPFIPLVIWALMLIYELMCLVLGRKRRDKLLIGFLDNGIKSTIERGFMLSIGFWLFYLGLGIGNYCEKRTG